MAVSVASGAQDAVNSRHPPELHGCLLRSGRQLCTVIAFEERGFAPSLVFVDTRRHTAQNVAHSPEDCLHVASASFQTSFPTAPLYMLCTSPMHRQQCDRRSTEEIAQGWSRGEDEAYRLLHTIQSLCCCTFRLAFIILYAVQPA